MLTKQEKIERNQILKKDFGVIKCNLNAALLLRLKQITEEASRRKVQAMFEPTDDGKEIFWV